MQAEFDFNKPKSDYNPLEFFLESAFHLRGHVWLTAKQILSLAPVNFGHDRAIREWAEKSDRIISGQKGYCLIENATMEEIHHASAWLISQGRKMVKRGIRIMRRYHAGRQNNMLTVSGERQKGQTT